MTRADRHPNARPLPCSDNQEPTMNHCRFTAAALGAAVLMSGCIAYPVGNRDGDRSGYSREGERTDCRDRGDCDRRGSDRRDGERRDDRSARP
jgi:hypothetical protein